MDNILDADLAKRYKYSTYELLLDTLKSLADKETRNNLINSKVITGERLREFKSALKEHLNILENIEKNSYEAKEFKKLYTRISKFNFLTEKGLIKETNSIEIVKNGEAREAFNKAKEQIGYKDKIFELSKRITGEILEEFKLNEEDHNNIIRDTFGKRVHIAKSDKFRLGLA